MTPAEIAQVCHEASRALCESQGDPSQKPWGSAGPRQLFSATACVLHAQANPDATAADMHAAWCAGKRRDGWAHGPVEDAEAKTHPCLVPFEDLPPEHRRNDALFLAIVRALSPESATHEARRVPGVPALDSQAIHSMFGLSYSAYQVLPRVVLQSMPPAWQRRFVELLAEIEREFPEIECGPYDVRLEDGADDPYRVYRHRRLTPKSAQKHEPGDGSPDLDRPHPCFP